jgi:hypothetical protein
MIEWKRNGITREVFLTKHLAVKIPTWRTWRHFLQGLTANINERNWWRWTNDQRLCPVRFALPGGWLIVMDRAEHIKMPEAGSYAEGFGLLTRENILRRLDEFTGLPVEAKPDSFGLIEGNLVAIDYGDGMDAPKPDTPNPNPET